jgi:hypothetical protein
MESYIQFTPLNNYVSNCVIKLHMNLITPNLPLNNCVIKLHIKLHIQHGKSSKMECSLPLYSSLKFKLCVS